MTARIARWVLIAVVVAVVPACAVNSVTGQREFTMISQADEIKLGESMLELKDQGVKMVSARYPNSGSDLEILSSPARPMLKVEDTILKKGEHLPLSCVMCHRELFQRPQNINEAS